MTAMLPNELLIDGRGEIYRVIFSRPGAAERAGSIELTIEAVHLEPAALTASAALSSLTRREREVAAMLANRATNNEIATLLGVSPFTARHHTESVMAKLGLLSRAGVRAALLHSLQSPAVHRREPGVSSRKRRLVKGTRTLRGHDA